MNSLPKEVLLRKETASPFTQWGLRNYPPRGTSSLISDGFEVKCPPCSLGNHPCPPTELQGSPLRQPHPGWWFWGASQQPPASQEATYSAISSRVNRNNRVQILLLDNVEFPRSLYLTCDTRGFCIHFFIRQIWSMAEGLPRHTIYTYQLQRGGFENLAPE